jgi:exosortase K
VRRFRRLPFVVLALLAAWGLKTYHSRAGADDLGWLLEPTCRLASVLSGARFEHEAGAGWVNHEARLIVGAGCSGMNFLIILFLTIVFAALDRVGGAAARALCLPASLAAAWGLTIAANAARILVALQLLPLDLEDSVLTAARLHRAAGALVYCVTLVLAHLVVERAFDRFGRPGPPRTLPQTVAPLGWYLAVVIGLPLLNQAWRRDTGMFLEHAALALAVALLVGASIAAARRGWRAAAVRRARRAVVESTPGRVPAEEP